ncbi:MAG: aldo/keto reductase [Pseudonocardiaceae bacterium]
MTDRTRQVGGVTMPTLIYGTAWKEERTADLVAQQVEQSFESSLAHLGVSVVDSYLLHTPAQPQGLTTADAEAWHVMETLHDAGRVRFLGVSNFTADQLNHPPDTDSRVYPG